MFVMYGCGKDFLFFLKTDVTHITNSVPQLKPLFINILMLFIRKADLKYPEASILITETKGALRVIWLNHILPLLKVS